MAYKKYTSEFLISELKRAYEELGRVPPSSYMTPKNGYPARGAYAKHFGSWNNAVKDAGLQINRIISYSSNKQCTRCGSTEECKWEYRDEKIICHKCANKQFVKDNPRYHKSWRDSNPDKIKIQSQKSHAKRKGFGITPLNNVATFTEGHHLHIENRSDFVINMPRFLHRLHNHSSKQKITMLTTNVIALDYWINEDMYNTLYEIDECDLNENE